MHERSAAFVGGVEHHAVEPGIGAARDEVEIRPPIGKEHGNKANARAGCSAERGKRCRGVAREQAKLDDVDPGLRHGANRGEDRRRRERQVADRRAGRPSARDRCQRGAEDAVGKPSQGAGGRLLQVDDVGAARNRHARLRRRADARQEPRHRVPPVALASWKCRMRSISQLQASSSRSPAVLPTAISR